jgi:hypothetical protein
VEDTKLFKKITDWNPIGLELKDGPRIDGKMK